MIRTRISTPSLSANILRNRVITNIFNNNNNNNNNNTTLLYYDPFCSDCQFDRETFLTSPSLKSYFMDKTVQLNPCVTVFCSNVSTLRLFLFQWPHIDMFLSYSLQPEFISRSEFYFSCYWRYFNVTIPHDRDAIIAIRHSFTDLNLDSICKF
jgi:hypothetical protein